MYLYGRVALSCICNLEHDILRALVRSFLKDCLFCLVDDANAVLNNWLIPSVSYGFLASLTPLMHIRIRPMSYGKQKSDYVRYSKTMRGILRPIQGTRQY
jgi:hypothetical protein